MAILLSLLLFGFCLSSFGYPQAGAGTTGSFVNDSGASLNAAAIQSARDYQEQQAEAMAAARAKAARDAIKLSAKEAQLNAAIRVVTDARDEKLTILQAANDTTIAILQAKADDLNARTKTLKDQKIQLDTQAAHEMAIQNYEPIDPWRKVDGKTTYAKGQGWVEFSGEVLEVLPAGILIHGSFGPPLGTNYGERDYFVADFTHKIADGEKITSDMKFNAYFEENTTYTVTNNNRIDGGVHTVRGLSYGTVVSEPPPELAAKIQQMGIQIGGNHPEIDQEIADIVPQLIAVEEQIVKAGNDYNLKALAVRSECDTKVSHIREEFANRDKLEAEAKARAVQDKVLKYNQEQADKGDPIGLLRMGERYRDGDCVPKDLAKARTYLQKAADAGSPTAADELKRLSDTETDR